MTHQPNNKSTKENPVGRFMVAVGAVVVHEETGNILIVKRAPDQDWHANEWEIDYGRIDQFEDPVVGLKRELFEEVGITDITVGEVLRVWHMYRGPKSAENDLIGITYVCTTKTKDVRLSHEHAEFAWVQPEEAAKRIQIEGIRSDVEAYITKVLK